MLQMRGHPVLLVWDLWGSALTASMAEMRGIPAAEDPHDPAYMASIMRDKVSLKVMAPNYK